MKLFECDLAQPYIGHSLTSGSDFAACDCGNLQVRCFSPFCSLDFFRKYPGTLASSSFHLILGGRHASLSLSRQSHIQRTFKDESLNPQPRRLQSTCRKTQRAQPE